MRDEETLTMFSEITFIAYVGFQSNFSALEIRLKLFFSVVEEIIQFLFNKFIR